MPRSSARRTVLAALLVAAATAPATASAAVDPLTLVSGPSPFAAGCEGAPQTGTVFRNAEVEPWVDVNLADANNLVGNWQQDRWSNGGASGNLSAYSLNGGASWTIPPISAAADTGQAKFSRCTGGNAANGGDFERATDPWVSFSPNGVAHQVALSINDSNVANAVLTSRSRDKGANWEDPVVVKFDDRANFFNDKETITADPTNSRFVYVTWQRIVAPNEHASARAGERTASFRSIAWFARSDDNGASYDVVKPVFNPGQFAQTIGNQIVVLPNGDLVMLFNLIRNVGNPANRGFTATVIRSTDRGDTWSAPIRIDRMITDGVTDPADGHAVRTGDLIPQIAVDENSGALYVVWQDDRFTGEEQIAFSRSTTGGRTWSPTRRISTVGGVNQAFLPTPRVASNGTVAVQYYDFRNDNPATTPPLTTDTWLLRSTNGGVSWTEERIGTPFDMTTAPDALGYFVGDYAGLDFAGGGLTPGFKPFHVRADSGNLMNRTDVFATTASVAGP
ncbi:MAG TPA: sialidase family protein [Solirubrobacter sp.]|nr:sialidase family protein [Solirubrobacter sp.]